MDMNENNVEKAMNMALELVKQLITLASGVLVLSAAFLPNIKNLSTVSIVILLLSWITLIVSIVLGIQTISAFVQDKLDESIEWTDGKGKKLAKWCRNLFIIGISIFVIFAIYSVYNSNNIENTQKEQSIINNYHINE